jgi:hypothetical protein
MTLWILDTDHTSLFLAGNKSQVRLLPVSVLAIEENLLHSFRLKFRKNALKNQKLPDES